MNKIFPEKLKKGDEIRVIACSSSMNKITQEVREIADKRFEDLGLKLSFGKHVNEIDIFKSSSIESRIEDLHEAFLDKNVKGILTVLGGFNANQLLDYINFDIIKNNPKVFCGFSDVTILNNAIFAKTGIVNYYGPFYSTFGQKLYFDYTLDYFERCLFKEDPYSIKPSLSWSDDAWYIDQNNRVLIPNDGYWIINKGKASGTILGGNLCTLNLLQGTQYFPNFKEDTILFIEDDEESKIQNFDRDLQSLIHQPNFSNVKGIVIGRFQNVSKISKDMLIEVIKTKRELNNLPIIANVDFGHTSPIFTFPIGGEAEIDSGCIKIIRH